MKEDHHAASSFNFGDRPPIREPVRSSHLLKGFAIKNVFGPRGGSN